MPVASKAVGLFVAACGVSPLMVLSAVDLSSIIGDSSIGGVVGALAGGSFSLWYGWYVTTTTIPRIVREAHEESVSERAMYREEMREARQTNAAQLSAFLAELAKERESRERQNALLADQMAKLAGTFEKA